MSRTVTRRAALRGSAAAVLALAAGPAPALAQAAPLDPADARLIELADAAEDIERQCNAFTAARRGLPSSEHRKQDDAFGDLCAGFLPIEEEVAGAALGTAALPAGISAPAMARTPPTATAAGQDPDAELFGLLTRRAEAVAVAKAAGVELDAVEEITGAAWDAKPEALHRQGRDFGLGVGPCSSLQSVDGWPQRFYTVDDVGEMMRGMEALRGLDLTPFEARMSERCREIIAAHAAWDAEVKAAHIATDWEAVSDRFDEAWNAVMAIERQIVSTPARSLAGLCAKAAALAEVANRCSREHVPVDFAREVAAFWVPT